MKKLKPKNVYIIVLYSPNLDAKIGRSNKRRFLISGILMEKWKTIKKEQKNCWEKNIAKTLTKGELLNSTWKII